MTTTDTPRPILDHGASRPMYEGVLVNLSAGADVVTAMSEAGLDYGVEKRPLYGIDQDAGYIESHPHGAQPHHVMVSVPDKALIVRNDGPLDKLRPLAVVGHEYHVITNLDAFAPLDALRREGRITFAQGGCTKDGRHAFLVCMLAEGATIPGGDPHQRYILAKTSHDGTGALRLSAMTSRLFCTNQIPAIIGSRIGEKVLSIHHGRKAGDRMAELPAMLDMMLAHLDEFDREWEALCATKATSRDVDEFLVRLFPTPHGRDVTPRMIANVNERRRSVDRLITHAPSTVGIRGTAAAMFAAATEWDQHGRGTDVGRRSARVLEGRASEFTRRAWELAHA